MKPTYLVRLVLALGASALTTVIAASSAFANDERLDRWFEQQIAATEGYAQEHALRSTPHGAMGRAGAPGMEFTRDRGVACLLIELQRTEGFVASDFDSAVCETSGSKDRRAIPPTSKRTPGPRG